MSTLNPAQQSAVEHISDPLLIVAGAGTGKTTVITEKIAYLIREKFATPEQILALTFTEKAATELLERVDARLELGYVDLSISTFHTFCQNLLQEYALDIGLPRQFKLLTETDAWLLLRDKIYELGLHYYRPLGNPTKYINDLLRHFSKCKDELITSEAYLQYAENLAHEVTGAEQVDEKSRLTELAHAYHVYNQIVLQSGALDFGDLIFYTVKLLRERPLVLAKVLRRYKYVLVDEFQDVNWAQYELVRLLSPAGEQGRQVTVVGDDDQSIYAFRGASVSNILRFKDDFPNARSVVLNENYRSQQEILDAAYKVIQHNNPERLEVKLGIDKKLVANNKKQITDGTVRHIHVQTLDDEVRSVIQEIISLKENNPEAVWDDFAILVRANNHAEPFIRGLEKAHVPYEFLSSNGLYRQPIVLDAFSFLKVIHQNSESVSLFRLLHIPCLQIDPADIQILTAAAKKKSISYFEALTRAHEWGITNPIFATVCGLLQTAIQKSKTEKPTTLLYNFFEESGYLTYLAREEAQDNRAVIRQIYQLKQFFDEVARFEETVSDPHVAHFVAYMESMLESGDEGKLFQPVDTPDSVNVMSVHGSKGLEFKYVFVVNTVEERFPTRRRGDGIDVPLDLIHEKIPEGDFHLQEERRLFYVACTRAKERLYFSSADSYGGVRSKKVSRFVIDALEKQTTLSKKSNEATTPKITELLQPSKSLMASPTHKPMNYELPKAYSFSQIKSYETCPYQYKLAHVLHIPVKGSASFSFGQTMHATLQDFYTRVQELNTAQQVSLFDPVTAEKQSAKIIVPTLDELLSMYEKHWITDWYKDSIEREEYYKKGRDILRKFYAAEEDAWTIPVSLEGWFKIKVGNYLVHGRIDRVDRLPDGSLHIIDYKTGQPKEKLSAEDKEQLLIYQIAAEMLPEYRHLGPTSQLTFHYLNDNTTVSFIGDTQELEKLRTKLTATIDNIQRNDFTPTPSQFVCKHCNFRDICEYRS